MTSRLVSAIHADDEIEFPDDFTEETVPKNKTVRVYRLEHAVGEKGPYNTPISSIAPKFRDVFTIMHNIMRGSTRTTPTIDSEFPVRFLLKAKRQGWLSGFTTKKDLEDWFRDALVSLSGLKDLITVGFVVCSYEAHRIAFPLNREDAQLNILMSRSRQVLFLPRPGTRSVLRQYTGGKTAPKYKL